MCGVRVGDEGGRGKGVWGEGWTAGRRGRSHHYKMCLGVCRSECVFLVSIWYSRLNKVTDIETVSPDVCGNFGCFERHNIGRT